jgi:hypothetical protein
MTSEHIQDQSEAKPIDWQAGRRAFLTTMGLGAAGAAMLSGSLAISSEVQAAEITDSDIFNFALNLEYLEAEFYLRAAFGRGLADDDTTGVGQRGAVKGGRKVPFATRNFQLYAEEIARDEEAHVKFIRRALGDAKVARPPINLFDSFNVAARAAGLVPAGGSFDPFANETNFLLAAFIFEDVGVSAYKGAAPLISDKGNLEAAAGILAVEAYHAGIIRTILFQLGLFKEAQAISDLRNTADGPGSYDQGIGSAFKANLVPSDGNGIAFSRTPGRVKQVVFLGDNNRGGFFPAGVYGDL